MYCKQGVTILHIIPITLSSADFIVIPFLLLKQVCFILRLKAIQFKQNQKMRQGYFECVFSAMVGVISQADKNNPFVCLYLIGV